MNSTVIATSTLTIKVGASADNHESDVAVNVSVSMNRQITIVMRLLRSFFIMYLAVGEC